MIDSQNGCLHACTCNNNGTIKKKITHKKKKKKKKKTHINNKQKKKKKKKITDKSQTQMFLLLIPDRRLYTSLNLSHTGVQLPIDNHWSEDRDNDPAPVD